MLRFIVSAAWNGNSRPLSKTGSTRTTAAAGENRCCGVASRYAERRKAVASRNKTP
jgi:hypothetical protein